MYKPPVLISKEAGVGQRNKSRAENVLAKGFSGRRLDENVKPIT